MLTLREQVIQRILQLSPDQIEAVSQYLNSMATHAEGLDSLIVRANGQVLGVDGRTKASHGALVAPLSNNGMADTNGVALQPKAWPHAPLHRLSDHGTFIVTASTIYQQHFFRTVEKLDYLEDRLLTLAKEYGWQLEAWAVFSNHYHFIAHATSGCRPLDKMIKHLHGESATEINQLDRAPARKVWFNYWDTQLTFQKSYFARLKYVHHNAVKHRLVKVANQYRWCSASWFECTSTTAQLRTLYNFKRDQIGGIE